MNNKNIFLKDGYLTNIDVFSKEEKKYLSNSLNYTLKKYDIINNEFRCKSHLLFQWVDFMVFHPTITNIVKEILGDNFLCIDVMFWYKQPKSKNFVSYHQDGYYWNTLDNINGLTVWVPFQDVNEDNGTLEYFSKSHTDGFRIHNDLSTKENLLRRGQTITDYLNKYETVKCNLKYGQVSMHHPCMIHGSSANISNKPRIACNIQFIDVNSPTVIKNFPEIGVLVNGKNNNEFINCVERPSKFFKKNYQNWYQAWFNQRQNYLINKGKK